VNAGSRSRFLLVLAVLVPPHVRADTQPLRHDPFARPALATLAAGNAGSAGPDVAPPPPPPWTPRLTAVMVAGKNSLVTLDGAIVRLGEVVDGRRLVEVREQEAVFQKGKKRFVVEFQATGPNQGKERGGR